MAVYVDDARHRYGRMTMCHMLADTEAELHAMADAIGVARRWYQGDHYDVCLAKRAEAVSLGAVEVTQREIAMIRRRNRGATVAAVHHQGEPDHDRPPGAQRP